MKDCIILHHSAIAKLNPQTQIIKESHKRRFGNKMKDGAYHVIIEKDGTVVWNPQGLDAILYHAGEWNERAIGICIAGALQMEPILEVQIGALYHTIQSILLNRDIKYIYNHREVRPTACPSIDLRSVYEKEVEARQVPEAYGNLSQVALRSILRGINRSTGEVKKMLERKLERLRVRIEARIYDPNDCCSNQTS